MARPSVTIKGANELIKLLQKLGDKRQIKRVLKKATNAAAQEVVKAVRAEWPEDTGISKKSVTKKVITTETGYDAIIGTDKDVSSESHGHPHVPSNIDHLIEFGWTTPEGHTVPGKAPLRRGYDNAETAALAVFEQKAREEIEREASKS